MQKRSRRRKRPVRGRTINITRVSLSARASSRKESKGHWFPPGLRCQDVITRCPACKAPAPRSALPGPCPGCGELLRFRCPWVGCKWHLYLDINPGTGSIKLNFPDLEPWQLRRTCALDEAWAAEVCMSDLGERLNLSESRIWQYEVAALKALKRRAIELDVADDLVGMLHELDDERAARDPGLYAFDVDGLYGDVAEAYQGFMDRAQGELDDEDLEGLSITSGPDED